MRTIEEAKKMLESLNTMQIDGMASDFPCPRCGQNTMKKALAENAVSRRANVHICSGCGKDEAMLDAEGKEPLPLNEWSMVKSFN